MGITVGDIYTAFPSFNPKDMIKLVGKKDFNGRTQISLANIARYRGGMAEELNIFTAKKEGKAYTGLLTGTQREKVAQKAKVNLGESSNKEIAQGSAPAIPMDVSVFDINKPALG